MENKITPKENFIKRREILKMGILSPLFITTMAMAKKLNYKKDNNKSNLKPTSYKNITHYNNFYEFTEGKDVYKYAPSYSKYEKPWMVTIDGLVDKEVTINVTDLIKKFKLQERVYRMRCVEAWSMVIPWVGFELRELLYYANIKSNAKYVEFFTRYDDKFPKTNTNLMNFPYHEGLRLDEAMHPLTILAVGIYGQPLTMENGAPMRLVVPWKYGFKGVKSINRITLRSTKPVGSWQEQNSKEYGFYGNVNPNVSHPRWSQASERAIGSFFRKDTLMYNGYSEVASMYKNLDLVKNY